MSRILRRPMFRGGRVDSRGTGIASGLGYEKGGRVGYFNGGEIYKNVAPYYTPKVNTSPGWSLQGTLQGIYDALNPTPETVLERLQKANPPDFGPGSVEPFIKTRDWEKRKGAWEQGEADKAEAEKQAEIDAAVAAAKAEAAEAAAAAGDSSGTPDETDAEKLEKYTELFEKAYGSGRGDDISNMLLSFAGKALKPEATVKSSFGEFFEDEAKRPSERKKYKDAATTAAINAFLTGEKTMAEVDAYLSKVTGGEKAKLNLLTDVAKGQSLNKRISDKAGKYTTKTAAFKGELPLFLEDNEIPHTGITYIAEEKVKLEGEDAKENVGEVFVDVDNNVVFIVVLENGVLKKKYLNK